VFAAIEIGFLIIGIFLGIWWFRHIIFPLSYSFYWTVRGWVRWYTPLRYLVGTLISVVLVLYLLQVAPYPLQNRFFGIGLVMGIVISIIRLLDRSARFVIRDAFAGHIKPYLTIAGTAALKLDPRTQELTDEDRAIAHQVWNDCWRHIIFYGAAVVAIIWLGLFARWLGLLLFSGLAIITLFDILKLFIVRGPGTLRTVMTLRSRKRQGTKDYKGMTAVAFVESMILVQYTFYLYFRLFR
jgi:hypothetical protein